MTTFQISKTLTAVCQYQKTRSGFRHVATLLRDGQELVSAKCCYLNRTWERYEFESVLNALLENACAEHYLTLLEVKKFQETIKTGSKHEQKAFKTIAMVAKMGEVLCQDQKAKNDWKARMLKAGLESRGLIMPEDWESLSEDEKESRLNKVIETMGD